ncbi:phosphatidylglycerol lysyltransferase domain-containing protein [Streptomyces sp. NPDC000963]
MGEVRLSAEEAPRGTTARSRRSAAFAVWYLRVVTFINFLGAVWVSFGQDLRRHNEDDYFTPYLLTAGFASGVFTLFLAITMRRRKRAAWILNLVLGGLFLLLFALVMFFPEIRQHAQNWVSLVLTAAFVLALLLGRKEFYAKGDRSNPLLAAAVAVGGLLVTSLLAAVLVTVTNTSSGHSTFLDRWRYGLMRLVTLASDDSRFTGIDTPGWVDVTINVLSTLLLFAVLLAAFRSRRAVDPLTEEDERRLRTLLDKYGDRDSLGYFALRREKSVVWSPSEKAAVAYRVVGGVSLASGDPIGDPEAWPGAIEPWLAEAREHGWIPAVMGASEEAGVIYARHGLDALELGDEAIVETGEFTLDGRAMRTVRQAFNRVKRAGYEVRIRRHEDIPAEEMDALVRKADDWRDGATERGFSMALGRLGDPGDGRCVMLECTDGQGELRALLSFVPWGPRGLSLDLMRRDREAENGLMEFMVIELLQRAGADVPVVRGRFTVDSGRRAMAELLREHPDLDAVFAANDLMAQGACQYLRERGVDVPGAVAVVGFDDSAAARRARPRLTTVRQPVERMAAAMAGLLVEELEGVRSGPASKVFAPSLVVRESA